MGAGVNLFKTLFAEDYYPYTANVLKSSKPTSKVIKDSNNQIIQTITLSGVELRGLLKVVDGKLVADGDIDDGSGTGEVRYAIGDLGALTFYKTTVGSRTMFYTGSAVSFGNMKNYDSTVVANVLSDTFITDTQQHINSGNYNGISVGPDNSKIRIVTDDATYSVMTAEQFKTAMSGKYLVYELATPTTQTLTAWNNPIKACEGGTEEFTDSRSLKMFCGHDSLYYTSNFKYW